MFKEMFIYFLAINLLGFYFIIKDKRKAQKRKWRISENTFMLISILGGSIGILLGMYTVKHKTKHLKFTLGIPIILLIQVLILLYI